MDFLWNVDKGQCIIERGEAVGGMSVDSTLDTRGAEVEVWTAQALMSDTMYVLRNISHGCGRRVKVLTLSQPSHVARWSTPRPASHKRWTSEDVGCASATGSKAWAG